MSDEPVERIVKARRERVLEIVRIQSSGLTARQLGMAMKPRLAVKTVRRDLAALAAQGLVWSNATERDGSVVWQPKPRGAR